jgi:hypothetical protein
MAQARLDSWLRLVSYRTGGKARVIVVATHGDEFTPTGNVTRFTEAFPGAALADLLGGQVQVMFGAMPSSIEYIRGRRTAPVGGVHHTRSDQLPDIPIVSDFVPGFDKSSWYGIGLGATVLPGSPADFGRLVAEDTAKWAKVVKFAGHDLDRLVGGRSRVQEPLERPSFLLERQSRVRVEPVAAVQDDCAQW